MKKSNFANKKSEDKSKNKVHYRKPVDSDSDKDSDKEKEPVTVSPTKANKAVLKKIRRRDNEY